MKKQLFLLIGLFSMTVFFTSCIKQERTVVGDPIGGCITGDIPGADCGQLIG